MMEDVKVTRVNMCTNDTQDSEIVNEKEIMLDKIVKDTKDTIDNMCELAHETNPGWPTKGVVGKQIEERDNEITEKAKTALSLKLGTSSILAFFVATFKDQILELLEFLISILSKV